MPSSQDFILSVEQLRARQGGKWRRFPPDVVPAPVADMDFAVATAVQDAIARLAAHNDYGYGAAEDPHRVANAFARRMRDRHGWDVDADLVACTSDVLQGMVAAILAFTERGAGIVVQTPIYPPFLAAVESTGRRLVENRLTDEGARFVVDADGLRRAIDPGTRMILLCNPHNPTGRVLARPELEAIAQVALEHDLVVVSDEIHADLVHAGSSAHIPIAKLGPEVAERTITLTSATKAFNIAGLRCAVAAFGSARLLERFRAAIPDQLLSSPNRFGVEATVAAWSHGDEWLARVTGLLLRNRDRVAETVAEVRGITHHPPEATYLAWLDCNPLRLPAASPYEFFLECARVGLVDGADFGEPGRGWVRLNFATSPEILDEVLDRMVRAVDEVAG